MKLTRTDFSSLAVIAVGGIVGLVAFGPQNFVTTRTVVTTDWEHAPMRVVLPSGEVVPFDRDVMKEGVVEFRRDHDRRRRRGDHDRRRRRPHRLTETASEHEFGPQVRIVGVRSDAVTESVEIAGQGVDAPAPLIYIDGVRVQQLPDLRPDLIERIEVLKGPAAEELYGEEASVGVVQIFLKREPAPNPGG